MTTTTFVAGTPVVSAWLNDVNTTVYKRTIAAINPKENGAVGDGITDDTTAIQTTITNNRNVVFSPGTYKITSTITIPSGTTIDFGVAVFTLATGATPGFYFSGSGLRIDHSHGGYFGGTASCVLKIEGSTNTPTLFSHYASLISIANLRINSTTITTGIVMSKAVNSVFMNKLNFYCPNGIDCSAAAIQINITDSVLYSSSGLTGTFGIKLRSVGGGASYNQGWYITSTLVDNYEIGHDIADVFQYEVTGGYHGVNATLAATTGYAFKFQAPTTTTLTDTITIGGGVVIAGRTIFANSSGGQNYSASIDALWTGCPGVAVTAGNNAAYIKVSGKFKNCTGGSGVGMVGATNNPGLQCSGDFDSTYADCAVFNGTVGTDCLVGPFSGSFTGDPYGGNVNVRMIGVPMDQTTMRVWRQTFSPTNLGSGATYAVAATIESLTIGFAKGDTGQIWVHLPFTGANATTQGLQLTLPTGMAVAGGTGYGSTNIYLRAANGLLSTRIDFWCTAAGAGSVVLKNLAGNTLTVQDQAWMGVIKN